MACYHFGAERLPADLLTIEHLGTNLSEILLKKNLKLFSRNALTMSFEKCQPQQV